MDIETACSFFEDTPYIYNKLICVNNLGLGYMSLGQQINSVSGGEAGRLQLAKEISKTRGKKNMLYIIDEPQSVFTPRIYREFCLY